MPGEAQKARALRLAHHSHHESSSNGRLFRANSEQHECPGAAIDRCAAIDGCKERHDHSGAQSDSGARWLRYRSHPTNLDLSRTSRAVDACQLSEWRSFYAHCSERNSHHRQMGTRRDELLFAGCHEWKATHAGKYTCHNHVEDYVRGMSVDRGAKFGGFVSLYLGRLSKLMGL